MHLDLMNLFPFKSNQQHFATNIGQTFNDSEITGSNDNFKFLDKEYRATMFVNFNTKID